MPRSAPPDVDADLVAFLHDLPDGATEAIRKITAEAAKLGARKASRSGWIRLGVESVVLGGLAFGALLKAGNVATKSDVAALEKSYFQSQTERSAQKEIETMRIVNLERKCDEALACCAKISDRIDIITSPRKSR